MTAYEMRISDWSSDVCSSDLKVKGNMDIELAIDAMEQSETVDHLVIFSGDGDFTTLVEALQRRGRKVSVVSTMSTQPPMIADDLRRQRSEERRVGQECVSTCRSRWWPYH